MKLKKFLKGTVVAATFAAVAWALPQAQAEENQRPGNG